MPETPPEESRNSSKGSGAIGAILALQDYDRRDDKIAVLEASLQEESNRHYEERFIWILFSMILIDAYVFTQMANWAGAIVIGILELFGIVIIADRCKVDTVAPLIDSLAGFARRVSNTDDPAK